MLAATDLDALGWQPVWLKEFLRFCADPASPAIVHEECLTGPAA